MGAATIPYVRWRRILPVELNLAGQTIANASTVRSNAFSINGWNQLSAGFALTRVAATAVTAYLELSFDGTTWFRQQASSISGGTEALSDHTMSKGSISGSVNWFHHFGGVVGEFGRLTLSSTAGTTDTIIVHGVLGVV
jgi:hypothetical protein